MYISLQTEAKEETATANNENKVNLLFHESSSRQIGHQEELDSSNWQQVLYF